MNDLAFLRATQNLTMLDTCAVLEYSTSTDSEGSPVPSWTSGSTSGSAISCGFKVIDASKAPPYPVPPMDAQVRIPFGTVVTMNDRILLTKRNGVVVTETYEIVGIPMDGSTATRVNLKRLSGV